VPNFQALYPPHSSAAPLKHLAIKVVV
jgi:hypothetical protein